MQAHTLIHAVVVTAVTALLLLAFAPIISLAAPAQTPAQEANRLGASNCSKDAGTGGLSAAEAAECAKQNPIVKKLKEIITFLAVGVGIAAVISIIFAGIQYITGGDNPQQIQAAKTRIIKTIAAVIIFLFMWAFLNWLLPGGSA